MHGYVHSLLRLCDILKMPSCGFNNLVNNSSQSNESINLVINKDRMKFGKRQPQ